MNARADARLAAAASRLSRSTRWEQVGEVPLRFDAHHPQGMVRVAGSWWISTVDLATGAGWVLTVDRAGSLVGRTPVGDGVRFHPGGMDHDGEALWVASSEYRPRSSAVIERLALDGSAAEVAFAVDDHVGAVVRLGTSGDLVGWNWGSRRFSRWRLDGAPVNDAVNPGWFVDHQDGQWLGDDLVLCGGVGRLHLASGSASIGGLGVLRASDLTMVCEVPFAMYSPVSGRPATQNPLFAEVVDEAMVVHVLPDDGRGVILTYTTPLAGGDG